MLNDAILQGYAVNETRTKQSGEVVRLMKRTQNDLDRQPVLTVIARYSTALERLDDYDHQSFCGQAACPSLEENRLFGAAGMQVTLTGTWEYGCR
ncbi:MAG: hypothetical protein IJ246_05120 [Clostridia bacterium]|nr:hypothetical protein [Clostridia bacterium]